MQPYGSPPPPPPPPPAAVGGGHLQHRRTSDASTGSASGSGSSLMYHGAATATAAAHPYTSSPQQHHQQHQQPSSPVAAMRRAPAAVVPQQPMVHHQQTTTGGYNTPGAQHASSYSYGGYNPTPLPDAPKPQSNMSVARRQSASTGYEYNIAIALFLLPSLWSVFRSFATTYPATTFLFTALFLYCLDLANLRTGYLYALWFSVILLTCVSGWFILIEADDEESGDEVFFLLAQIGVHALLFVCTACWLTLQMEWLSKGTLRGLEQSLHGVLPLASAAVLTFRLERVIEYEWGRDVAGISGPFVFTLLLATEMLVLGAATNRGTTSRKQQSSERSRSPTQGSTNGSSSSSKDQEKTDKNPSFILSRSVAFVHTAILLVTPVAMHLATCLARILSRHASFDDWYDLLLVVAVPFLIQCGFTWLQEAGIWPTPYPTPKLGNTQHLSGAILPLAAAIGASIALQQRYLIPACHDFSYHFMGTKAASSWILSLYWTGATMALLFALLVWNRRSTVTNEVLFGEYHEDVVQLSLSVVGLLLGKAFGLPWNFTPLPVLAFLGLSLWLTTRMLRYLCIFLFVFHATGVMVFTYRFAGIDHKLALPLPGVQLSLIRFGLVVVSASILIGLVAGIAVRSTGGFGSGIIKRFDLAGLLTIVYTVCLTALEIALLKRPVPGKELSGVQAADEVEDDEMLYDHVWSFFTSALLVGIAAFMQRAKIVSSRTSWIVVSLAIGKAIAIYIDVTEEEDLWGGAASEGEENDEGGTAVFVRSLVAALLCVVMFAPRVFLQPVYVKSSSRFRRSMTDGRPASELPAGTMRTILLYIFVFLPVALAIAIPYVLFPLANAVAGDYRSDSYYSVTPPVSELIGASLSIWGLACLSMLNHYLPDGGAEMWKKLSALSFLMGVGIFFAAPTLGVNVEAAVNPYASISSVGTQLIAKGKSRTGGWGLVLAALATLLAITGPLELKERRTDSVRRDKYLLFRTMIFSIMFGGGVAWFIIMQSMSEADTFVLLLTLVACMTIAFLGTVAAVLGYFMELEDFEEVQQIFNIWLICIPVLLPVSGLPQILQRATAHAFGSGGWLSTYLAVCSIEALALALALRMRSSKNATTRGLANLSCILSWVSAIVILYGRYGVAGMDVNFDVTMIFGIPASIFGTIVISPMLLALEGEQSRDSRGRGRRVTMNTTQKESTSAFALNFPTLTRSNAWVPMLAGATSVLLLSALYAVLLRGNGILIMLGGGTVARTHEEVFSTVFGEGKDEHDLATLAEKTISHSQALAASAKLARSGFWTSDSIYGPTLHLVGLVATLPSQYLVFAHAWYQQKVTTAIVTLALPLNLIPLILCRGIPSLRAAAAISFTAGLFQLLTRQRAARESAMRI